MTPEIYIGTVGLDRNRWGSRQPSFLVSQWLERFAADGFDGVELWGFHYREADETERKRLVEQARPLAIYNSYAGFADGDAEDRAVDAEAVKALGASGVKYNLGHHADLMDEYRRNLLTWASDVPTSCKMLCECHQGSVLEDVDVAAEFFCDMPPERYAVIAHLSGDAEGLESWFTGLPGRVEHIHVQMRSPETDPAVPENRPAFEACFEVLKRHTFQGSITMEFSRGIGKDEDIETLYANTCIDAATIREGMTDGN